MEKSMASSLWNLTEKVNDTARVAPFVVVPRDQLDEVVVQGDTGLGVKGG